MNNYNFKEVENKVLSSIDLQTEYKSNPNSNAKAFVTIMPPPNITGSLHIGHALVLTLQDILTRYHRMKGFDTLWQAGIDHAGIATQLVVEKQLNERGVSKEDLGQDNFIQEILKWKEKAQSSIINQIKKIGASCDFSNIAFTFSPEFNNAVNKVFLLLYEEGLIYQAYKLVNWDTKFTTAISDLEINYKEEKGKLYYVQYKVSSTESITIATTRPETMFGDTAIAVNPKDKRYINLIGKKAIIPIINKEIPIIADSYSNMNKGSGAVKITPAHDFNDFEVGKRHNLPLVVILDSNGKLNDNVPKDFQRLSVNEARVKVINTLTQAGCLTKIEKHVMQVPYGDRSNVVIEPLPSKQWFLDVSGMAKEAIDAVKSGRVTLIPSSWKNLYFEWLNNIQPWCISRQLWWGHRIPVWYSSDGKIFVANNKQEALEKAKDFYGKEDIQLVQESSVLDTWFSSALWPFVTLGWPDTSSKRFKKYYPTSSLVTGFDIIFFWVSRMIMMGSHILKTVPFKKVYLHSLVLDSKGQKMSKTKGNVLDPLSLMDKYGTDAFRFTLASYSSSGQNIKFSENNLVVSRNFITKVWNCYNFLSHYKCKLDCSFNPNSVKVCLNKWILLQLEILLSDVCNCLNNYQFSELSNKIYHFVWSVYCDWYIEIIKIIFTKSEFSNIKEETTKTAIFVFNILMCVMHPIMPFITQYLYNLINNDTVSLTRQKFPPSILNSKVKNVFQVAYNNIESILNLIHKIRSIRGSLKVPASALIDLYMAFNENNQSMLSRINNFKIIIKKLARINNIFIVKEVDNNLLFSEAINSNLLIGLDIKNVIDVNNEIKRLNKEKDKITNQLNTISTKLSDSNFSKKAPASIVESFNFQKVELTVKLETIHSTINKLKRNNSI